MFQRAIIYWRPFTGVTNAKPFDARFANRGQRGYYEVNKEIQSQIPLGYVVQNIFSKQCFIPSASSMALNNKNLDWSGNFTSLNIPTNTPFRSIKSAVINEDHTLITPAIVTFILSKLSGPSCF